MTIPSAWFRAASLPLGLALWLASPLFAQREFPSSSETANASFEAVQYPIHVQARCESCGG